MGPLRLSKGLVLLTLVLTFLIPSILSSHQAQTDIIATGSNPLRIDYHNVMAPVTSAVAFDEQVGISFTQDFASLSFNVTAVEQTGLDGVGPGYLLNGLTNAGYWYQVGLSWKWPTTTGSTQPGFSMNYEVFNSAGQSIFPSNGGGIASILVAQGDIVLLSLSFSNNEVVMHAHDWNTTDTANESYSALGATVFLGTLNAVANANGFFTGLMTEQYHSSAYGNGPGSPVFYTSTTISLSSAWMWMDEFDVNTFSSIFRANTTSPVQLQDSPSSYFTSNGTAEAANRQGLVTGLLPAVFPVASPGVAVGYRNHQASVTVLVQEPGGATVRFLNTTISSSLLNSDQTLSASFTFSASSGLYNLTISLPTNITTGNYTLAVHIRSWQYQEPQAQQWIQLPSVAFNETLIVSNSLPPTSPPSTNTPTPAPGSGPSISGGQSSQSIFLLGVIQEFIITAIATYLALVVCAVCLVVVTGRRKPVQAVPWNPAFCQFCGSPMVRGFRACPTCGAPRDSQRL